MDVKGLLILLFSIAFLQGGHGSRSVALDGLITSALKSFRKHMSTGWPDIEVPLLDPVEISRNDLPYAIDSKEWDDQSSLVSINQISEFDIYVVESNVLFLRTAVELHLPLIAFTGAFSAELRDVAIDIGVTFSVSEYDAILQVDALNAIFDTSESSSNLADETLLLEIIQSAYQPYFEKALKYEIDVILQGGNHDDLTFEDDPIDDYFDRLLADIRQLILEDHLDPTHLPEDSDDFSVELFNKTMEGSVWVNQGTLKGLSTIHRAGNMSVEFVGIKAEVIWDGEIGFNDLEIQYTFGLDLPVFGKELSLSLKFSYVHLSFETDVFLIRENITLARCNISELGPVHFTEKGAGPLDTSLYDLLVNTFLGSLHTFVMEVGGDVVCGLLEDVLSHV